MNYGDEASRVIREAEFDHVIRDGKIYLNANNFTLLFDRIAEKLLFRGILTQDLQTVGASSGMTTAAGILREVASELMRREADAIVKTSFDPEGGRFGDPGDNGAS